MTDIPITKKQRLNLIRNYIDRMPSLSTTVNKVLEVCDNPRTSPNALNRVIALDPVLTGQVLKLINSAYYSLPYQISSLSRAIIMLGLNTVKNLALTTAVLESLGGEGSFHSLSMDAFWIHSICVGVTAKALAAIKGVPALEREEYFVAGMLHDLGKIPLNNRFVDDYSQSLALAKLEQSPLYRAEDQIMGIDHTLVGGMIAEKWKLSKTIVDSLQYHHQPESADEGTRLLVSLVALANMYANTMDFGSAGDNFPEERRLVVLLKEVGVDWPTLSDLSKTVIEEIEKAKIFLQLTQGGRQ